MSLAMSRYYRFFTEIIVGAHATDFTAVRLEVGSSGPMMKPFTVPEFAQIWK
jgi:hypothetical protein